MKITGLNATNVLLPNTNDMTAWACIACDQFTSEPDYWNELERQVSGKKTTLDLVLPEIYLEDNVDERIEKVNSNIKEYLKNGTFNELPKGFVLVVRSTPYVKKRIGLVGAIDLEMYDYKPGNKALIRATEGTIEERIPPRLKIRKNADVEFPHVMVLFDDEKREILEQLYENRHTLKKLYDFDLNMNGGHVEGYLVEDYQSVLDGFSNLLDEQRLISKYGFADKFAFAVGDGNHSLATAKTMWNLLKSGLTEEEKASHPARFALCEMVNVYDDGIYFEPIFRFIKGVDKQKFMLGLSKVDGGDISVITGDEKLFFNGKNSLPDGIREVDSYIKDYIAKFGGSVDYIHGEENLTTLVKNTENSVGIFFKKLDKQDLFKYVSKNGAFPRKTFSMGEAIEKRYYLEGRRITK